MRLQFIINRDDISPERLEEYKKALNVLIGYDGKWEIERTDTRTDTPVLLRCNCGILGIPDRQCSRRATVGEFCTQHAKMDKPGDRVFRWE